MPKIPKLPVFWLRPLESIHTVKMQTDLLSHLAALIRAQAFGQGFLPSPVPGVVLMQMDRYLPRMPTVYEPCIVIVAQGYKICTLNNHRYRFDTRSYLALTLPLPVETETFGSAEEPFLGLAVSVTPALVTELMLQMESLPAAQYEGAPIASAAMDDKLLSVAVRLAEAMQNAEHSRVLGPGIVRELVYRLLCREDSEGLRSLAISDSRIGRISKVVHQLHSHAEIAHDVSTLARDAGMSLSSFHAAFKATTGESPLQYLKKIRLHRARERMVNEGLSAQTAALSVGYESTSQFSREFKRQFGNSPSAESMRLRALLSLSRDSHLRATLSFQV